jgi:hypothetical protein
MAKAPKRLLLVGPVSQTPNPGTRWQVMDEHYLLVGWVTEQKAVGFTARTLSDDWMSDGYHSLTDALSALELHLTTSTEPV